MPCVGNIFPFHFILNDIWVDTLCTEIVCERERNSSILWITSKIVESVWNGKIMKERTKNNILREWSECAAHTTFNDYSYFNGCFRFFLFFFFFFVYAIAFLTKEQIAEAKHIYHVQESATTAISCTTILTVGINATVAWFTEMCANVIKYCVRMRERHRTTKIAFETNWSQLNEMGLIDKSKTSLHCKLKE